MAKKKKMSAWGKLRIQAGVAKRQGKHSEAKKLRAKADRLQTQAKKKPAGKKKAARKKATKSQRSGMTAAVEYIKATSKNLGLTPQQTVDVFRAGIRTTLSKGLGK